MRRPNPLTILSIVALIVSAAASVYLVVIRPSLNEEPPRPTEVTEEPNTAAPTAERLEADTPTLTSTASPANTSTDTSPATSTATPTALPSFTPTVSGLPDLVVDAFGGDMVPAPRCLPLNPDKAVTSRPYSICVLNQGDGPAGSFDIAVDDNLLLPVDGLAAGEQYCIASGDGGQFFGWPGVVRVDPNNQVAESDETNNYDGFIAATPPPFCTPTP